MRKSILSFFILFVTISFNPSKAFTQDTNNILIEYVTATWCGNCPCAHVVLENLENNHENVSIIGYHGGGNDPWASNSAGIRALFGFFGQPTGVVGRQSGIINSSSWNSEFLTQKTQTPGVRVEIDRTYNNSSRVLNATANVTALSNLTGSYNINFVLTEGNIMYPQNFYSNCGTPGYQNDYIHHHVCKAMINGDEGQNIYSNGANVGDTVSKSISYTIPSAFVADNCTLVVFIYKVGGTFGSNNHVQQSVQVEVESSTGVGNNGTTAADYNLSQNYPNPFNPSTSIHFSIPKDGIVSLKIYDVLGNEVSTYYDGFLKAGNYNAEFNGSNLSSGVYFYTLTAGDPESSLGQVFVGTKKMILMK
jgi:thiol-disulfide isomerase/thioredoxin